jgi:hypothetical protein
MISKMDEINRVLIAAANIGGFDAPVPTEIVMEQCSSTVIEGRMPNHEQTISFSQQLGFVECIEENLVVTGPGKSFLDLNPERKYDLSDEQKKVILRTCYLHGPLRSETYRLLRAFSPAFREETFRWSEVDNAPLGTEPWLTDHLLQLGLLAGDERSLSVRNEYAKTIAVFLEEGKGWSEEQFQEYLREKQEIGDLAENLVLDFERQRLDSLGCIVEPKCVRRISRVMVNAGYDIESYDSFAEDVNYDRFIEVKGSRGASLRFFWTRNEMEVAEKLGPRYWIYFQGGVDAKQGIAKNKPLMFQNPLESLLNDETFTKNPQGLIVEAKLKGEEIPTAKAVAKS